MSNLPPKDARPMPKGGRKGGAQYPRSTLDDAFGHAKKLVTKTHVSTMARDAVYAGVVGAKSGLGNMRISALKLYGYLEGKADAYKASAFAKRSVAAPPEELIPLHQQAALRPPVFKALFDTFHGDTVSRAKLRQRAAELKVHPEETESCVEIYLSTLATARLVQIDGDKVIHSVLGEEARPSAVEPDVAAINDAGEAESDAANAAPETGHLTDADTAGGSCDQSNNQSNGGTQRVAASTPRAVFNVNVTLDSSLDIEKLQKQLELLKRFGAI